jgi:DNA-binding transcriptional LysR family regulator
MTMDRLQAMRVFERVVDEGGFAAAARSLDMSAPVVTRMVAELESQLGTRLLQRSTRRVSLTEAGQSYLDRVRHILQDVDEADAVAGTHATELAGVLRLHAQPLLASFLLAPLISEFRQRHPRIHFDIEANFLGGTSVENFDITLMVTDDLFDGDVVARKVIESETILVASPSYLARSGTPQTPADLAGHDLLRLRLRAGERPRLVRMWRPEDPQNVVEIEPRPGFTSNHVDTLLQAALCEAGIASTSVDLVAPYLARGDLVRVLQPWVTGRIVVYAALPSRKFMPRRTRVFLDYLVEETRRQQAEVISLLGCPG